jgi:catechol 2,3-dioxygenase-like lactoylglutathione lyase family enzyme
MPQHIGSIALLVRDYDEAIAWFTTRLGFVLTEDTDLGAGKRWVMVAPPGPSGSRLLLAKAATPEQLHRVGDQAAGRVFLFLHTDDCRRDYEAYRARGVAFCEEPREEPYGTVVVFKDLCGNRWDLLQLRRSPPSPID